MDKAYIIPDAKIEKLTKQIKKSLNLTLDEAKIVIYKEADLIEELFIAHKKVKAVHKHFLLSLEHE